MRLVIGEPERHVNIQDNLAAIQFDAQVYEGDDLLVHRTIRLTALEAKGATTLLALKRLLIATHGPELRAEVAAEVQRRAQLAALEGEAGTQATRVKALGAWPVEVEG